MGYSLFLDEAIQNKLITYGKSENFQIGLIIGQNGKENDYVAHVASTPFFDMNCDEITQDESKTKVPTTISEVSDSTVYQHARQVVRMLPGGLDIIGLFVATSASDFNESSSHSKFKLLVTGIHKAATRVLLDMQISRLQKVIIHVCSESQKLSCISINLGQSGNPISPVNIKVPRSPVQWQQLNSSYNLDVTLWLPCEKTGHTLQRLLANLKPWATSISDCQVLIDGSLRDHDDLLVPVAEEKPVKRKGGARGAMMDFAPPKVFSVDFLDTCKPLELTGGKLEKSGCVKLTGVVACRAFVHQKALVEEAVDAIKIDLVRSVFSRWEMHCDSLVEEPPAYAGPVVHEPPLRVFFEGGGLCVSLCDYLFPGDTPADACQSAKELLGVIVHEENVDTTLETLTDASSVFDSMPQEEMTSGGMASSSERTSQLFGSSQGLIIVIISAVVLVIAGLYVVFFTPRVER